MNTSLPTLRKTPLHALHCQLNAKMVDFGGWHMPLSYNSQIAEHETVRRDAGIFDVSHMRCVDVCGDNAQAFLEKLLANDILKLDIVGRGLYSCMLNNDGGIIDDLIVYRVSKTDYRIVVNAATAESDFAWMTQHATPFNIHLHLRADLAMVAIQGPKALEKMQAIIPAAAHVLQTLKPFHAAQLDTLFIARTGYTGEDGLEILLPASDVQALWQACLDDGIIPCGLGARDTLRLEAGMNLYGQDMDTQTTPFETGLGWTVSKRPEHHFIGHASLKSQAPRFIMLGILLNDGGILRPHQSIETTQGTGELSSGSFSPSLKKSIGFARVPTTCRVGDSVNVLIRGRQLSAQLVKLPFIRHGQIMISF